MARASKTAASGSLLMNPQLNDDGDVSWLEKSREPLLRTKESLFLHLLAIFGLSAFLCWQTKEAFGYLLPESAECWILALIGEFITGMATLILGSRLGRPFKLMASIIVLLSFCSLSFFFGESISSRLQDRRPELNSLHDAISRKKTDIARLEEIFSSFPSESISKRSFFVKEIQKSTRELESIQANLEAKKSHAEFNFSEAYHVFVRIAAMLVQLILIHWFALRLRDL